MASRWSGRVPLGLCVQDKTQQHRQDTTRTCNTKHWNKTYIDNAAADPDRNELVLLAAEAPAVGVKVAKVVEPRLLDGNDVVAGLIDDIPDLVGPTAGVPRLEEQTPHRVTVSQPALPVLALALASSRWSGRALVFGRGVGSR